MQVRWGLEAPAVDWKGNMGGFDADTPLFNGTGGLQDRMTPLGIANDGSVLFTAGRFGIPQTEGRPLFFQSDDHIIWQVQNTTVEPFSALDESASVDFKHLSNAGQAA